MKIKKKHDKHKLKVLFLNGYCYNDWFNIQDEEESDNKRLEGDKEEIDDIPFMPQLEGDEEEVKEGKKD